MKCVRLIGAALAVLMLGVFFASTASASVTFLLAEWLEAGQAISSPKPAEGITDGPVMLIDLDGGGLGITVEILCEGFGIGTVGPTSAAEVTAFLNSEKEEISGTPLVGLALLCTNSKNCTEPKIWPENLPWKNELELMEDGAELFFVDLTINGSYYIECLILGVSVNELCSAPVGAIKVTNEANGTVDGELSDAFQELAELKLGECGGRAEVAELEGLGTLKLDSGAVLTASSGT